MPRLGLRGIQRLTVLDDLVVLSGAGVGGGSLVYANTLYEPLDPFYRRSAMGGHRRLARRARAATTSAVRRMLGATETPFESAAEPVIREVARRMGVSDTFERTTVAVDFDRCVRCGGCMVGCRYGAKNTLDRNYLRLAEAGGAVVHAEREATRLRRADGGWEVETEHARAPGCASGPSASVREQVVLAAGVLGTLKLLLALGRRRPERRRARALELGGDRRRRRARHGRRLLGGHRDRLVVPPERRHAHRAGPLPEGLEPDGSLLDRPRRRRRPRAAPAPLARRRSCAIRSARVQAHVPCRWAERTVILLVMQARDNALRVRWTGRRLRSERATARADADLDPRGERGGAARRRGDGRPPRLGAERGAAEPAVHRAHPRRRSDRRDAGGAASLDGWHRVWSEPGLHVVDGSAVSANLGANPSLTIAAQAERALVVLARPRRGRTAAAARVALRAVRPTRRSEQRPSSNPAQLSDALELVGMPARWTTTWVLTARCR